MKTGLFTGQGVHGCMSCVMSMKVFVKSNKNLKCSKISWYVSSLFECNECEKFVCLDNELLGMSLKDTLC